MATVGNAWNALTTEQEDSAKLLGATDIRVFFTITLFKLLPSIISAIIPIYIYCFFSFMIVQLFGAVGTTTLETAIYHAGRSSLNFRAASIFIIIETSFAMIILTLYAIIEEKSYKNKGESFYPYQNKKTKLSLKERLFVIAYFIVLFIFFFLPFISILVSSITQQNSIAHSSFSLNAWMHLFRMKNFLPAIKNTLLTASCTAALCTICALVFSVHCRLSEIQHSFKYSKIAFRTIPILPMAVSSVATGMGLSSIIKPGFSTLTGIAILCIAQTSLLWPLAFRQIHTHISKIPDDTINSARLLSQVPPDFIFKVLLPQSYRGILSAFGFCFASSAGDAVLPLVLSVPHFETFAVLTYRLAGSYRYREASAAGLLLGILCMTTFMLSNNKSISKKKLKRNSIYALP